MNKKYFKRSILYIAILLFFVIISGFVFGYKIYSRMYSSNINLTEKKQTYIYIPTNSSYSDVLTIIDSAKILVDMDAFKWVSSRMGYPHSVKPGRYKVSDGMNNKELVTKLRAGIQTPTRVTFTGFRTPQQLAQRISEQLEVDSAIIVQSFYNVELVDGYGFTPETFIAMFIPNTYEFFWNTDAKGFFDRMKREYEAFWNEARDKKASEIGLDRVRVSTLASIVEEETVKVDERPRVAGVFMNRLNKGIPLQADPTIKYAVGDFSIRRILTRHLQIDSPYNTYKHRGLPPGPINAPNISSINAVLNYEKHQYLYFCAKADFSGYHAFARTLSEHNRNAREYQQALNKERIYR
jgi:UPF0755 protein